MTARLTIVAAIFGAALAGTTACSRAESPPAAATRDAAAASTATANTDAAAPAPHTHDPAAPPHTHGASPASGTTGRRAPERRYDGPLPPIPTASFVPPRPADVVKATYEFAGRRPDVLQYVPCFCMCERSGHVGNDDCFVSKREADGRPTWDLHGMG